MQFSFTLFFNFFVPLIIGLFFLLYFVYFVFANPSRTASYRYFLLFLLSFGVFIIGRALQVVAGSHPLPLIIVNLRIFILCAVVSPMVMLTANVFRRKRNRRLELAAVLACVALGLVYVVFNTLGTRESYLLYEGAGLTLRDNLTPSRLPPFYAREVTLGVQALIGLMLFAFSLDKLLRLKLESAWRDFFADKNFLVNTGIFVFAVFFIAGSLARQWWIFYAASTVSALCVGASVIMDVKEVHSRYEKLLPLVKSDILNAFALKDCPKGRIGELLRMLGKKPGMDTFAVMGLPGGQVGLSKGLAELDAALACLEKRLRGTLEEEDFLLLPISNERIGIILAMPKAPRGLHFGLLELLEEAQGEISRAIGRDVRFGIGRSYGGPDGLGSSYREAVKAQEFAAHLEGGAVVHAENMGEAGARVDGFPVREKERLLSAVKAGDVEGSRRSLADFMAGFEAFVRERPGILKVRLYELAGSLIDAGILGGGDEKRLSELVARYFDDIALMKDAASAPEWLAATVAEISASVGRVRESRSRTMVEGAKRFIEKNFQSQIGYKDAAKEIFISPSYFLNLFKRETGLTFTDYLTRVRIERAKELLRTSGKNITEIAYEVGYNDSNYFSAIFKKAVGVPAKEFRKGA